MRILKYVGAALVEAYDYYKNSQTGITESLCYRGIRMKAKRPGKCFISGHPIKVGDDILWLPKTQYVALEKEAEDCIKRMKMEDDDLRTMGYDPYGRNE